MINNMEMKDRIKTLGLVAVMASVMGACTLETSGNGDLDGFWHLVAVDTVDTGGVLNLSDERLFWSFQGNLLSHRDADGRCDELISYFERSGDSLFVTRTFFYDRPNSDPVVEDVGVLRPYGINKLGEHFYVQHLDGGTMILLSDKLRLYLKKM